MTDFAANYRAAAEKVRQQQVLTDELNAAIARHQNAIANIDSQVSRLQGEIADLAAKRVAVADKVKALQALFPETVPQEPG